jgi:hypothetical protein
MRASYINIRSMSPEIKRESKVINSPQAQGTEVLARFPVGSMLFSNANDQSKGKFILITPCK